MTFTQILLLAAAAVVAERAEPTAHFILLATQRTGSTWVMSELSKHSSCIATGTELFLDHKGFKWTESSRVRCLKTLYGSEIDKKQKPHKCSESLPSPGPWVRTGMDVRAHVDVCVCVCV